MKKYKMVMPLPESVTAPDKVETSVGTLEYFDGVPKANSVEKVYDYRARAVEAFLNCIPVMSMYMIREGQREAGQDASNKDIVKYCSTITVTLRSLLLCLEAHDDKLRVGCRNSVFNSSNIVREDIRQYTAVAETCWADIGKLCTVKEVGEGRIA